MALSSRDEPLRAVRLRERDIVRSKLRALRSARAASWLAEEDRSAGIKPCLRSEGESKRLRYVALAEKVGHWQLDEAHHTHLPPLAGGGAGWPAAT